jgi:hypothetical protein
MAKCAQCKFWEPTVINDTARPIGQCRRRAPVPVLVGQAQHPVTGQPFPIINGYFPETRPDIWCGDFERGEAINGPLAIDLSKLDLEGAVEQ